MPYKNFCAIPIKWSNLDPSILENDPLYEVIRFTQNHVLTNQNTWGKGPPYSYQFVWLNS